MLIELVAPKTKTLASLARMKAELGLTDVNADRDDYISTLILEASAMIVKEIGYPVWRARVRETLVGEGRSELMLTRTPIVKIMSVSIDDEVVLPEEYQMDQNVGVLFHNEAWQNTRHFGHWVSAEERPDEGRHKYVIDYWAGVFGPDDDINASGIGVDGTNEKYLTQAPPLLVEGDIIESIHFGESSNNGQFIVVTRSETGITVEENLSDEIAAPSNARIRVRNLDRALERLCVQAVKSWFISGSEHDPAVTSEKIGDWAASYGASTNTELTHDLPPGVLKSLERWRRIV
jgi:hypothetical protein